MKLKTDKMIAEKEGGIGWVVFNNPERRNAVSLEMWEAVGTIFDEYERDPEVRVAVMKGAGDKSFVAGADISQFEERRNNAEAAEEYARISGEGAAKMATFSKPLVAMIRGFCIGGGLATAMRADIRIAAEDAQFGIPAARLGLAYNVASLQNLVTLVGPAVASEILFTARRYNAEEALKVGLVNRVVPIEELEAAVRALAAQIAENAPLTIKASKATIAEVLKSPQERDQAKIDALFRQCMDSQDYAEGRRAFMEKRKPAFAGR
jgi:enoyl-CoA hydratase/carnithine racemase